MQYYCNTYKNNAGTVPVAQTHTHAHTHTHTQVHTQGTPHMKPR